MKLQLCTVVWSASDVIQTGIILLMMSAVIAIITQIAILTIALTVWKGEAAPVIILHFVIRTQALLLTVVWRSMKRMLGSMLKNV